MNPIIIQLYNDYLLQLKRGNYKGLVSNAKPIALLSIIAAISNSAVKENKILFDNLISYYKEVNRKYGIIRVTPLSYPFYHLATEPFYHLMWKVKPIKRDAPPAKFIRDNIEYAYLDEELWDLLQVEEIREQFKTIIEDYYLSEQ